MTDPELVEAVRAMRQTGETLREVMSEYHRVLVELEEVREGMVELDQKLAALVVLTRKPTFRDFFPSR